MSPFVRRGDINMTMGWTHSLVILEILPTCAKKLALSKQKPLIYVTFLGQALCSILRTHERIDTWLEKGGWVGGGGLHTAIEQQLTSSSENLVSITPYSPCPMPHSGTEINIVRGQGSETARTRLVGIILQISRVL